MLTIKANSKNINTNYRTIPSSTISSNIDNGDDTLTIVFTCSGHGLQNGNTIIVNRDDGSKIHYNEKYSCTVINSNVFSIVVPKYYQLYPQEVDKKDVVKPTILNGTTLPKTGDTISYGYFNFSGNTHIFQNNRDDVSIDSFFYWNSDDKQYEHDGRTIPCDDDYLLFNETYLVQNNLFKNITGETIYAEPINGNSATALTVAVVPIDVYGNDNTNEVLLTKNDIFESIYENLHGYQYYCLDRRFFNGYQIKNGVVFYEETGGIKVPFLLGDSFEINTFKDDFYRENYVQEEIDREINAIVNYERYPYEPMFYNGEITETQLKSSPDSADTYCCDVDKIEFNLNFRVKSSNDYDDGSGKTIYHDFGSWNTNNFKYWNNYEYDATGSCLTYKSECITGNTADLLGWLGFTDDDVYYQKSALKKSFLRLSFYDSTDRRTQKLLFYSTVYLDSNEKFGTYIKALQYSNTGNTEAAGIVFSDKITGSTGELLQLRANLFCTSKYDESSSSDGFYLHLFDQTTEGNQFSEIYMKVEFNNAKTGKIIPMIHPLNNENIPIDPTVTATTFPINYLISPDISGSTRTISVDTEKLEKDMYTKILVKYNYKKNKYMWMLPTGYKEGYNTNIITFNLFEPRIYGYNEDYHE